METITKPKIIHQQFTEELDDWDLVIEPKAGWLNLNLSEVWRYRDLLVLFVKRDFAAQYKQTVLGPIWHLVQPALTTALFLLVFGHYARIPTDGVPPVLFYLSGITLWNYFAACFTTTASTFTANAGIFGKVYFPRLVLPLSVVASNMVRLGIQLVLLIVCLLYFIFFEGLSLEPGLRWLLVPVLVLIMAGLGLGLGIIISSLTTKYRDFGVLIGFGMQLLMYATPVVYPLSFLKNKSFAGIVEWNPLSPVLEGFRYAVFNTGEVGIESVVYSLVFTFLVLFIGAIIFNKVERTFMDTV